MKIKELEKVCLEIAPLSLQESWDNSGPQVIFPDKQVKKVLLALDLTDKVLNEAIKKKCEAVIVHHPPIFKPLKQINFNYPPHHKLMQAIQNQISIFALHTNFDSTINGMNDYFLNQLKCINIEPLMMSNPRLLKLVVYVPQTHTELVREAICQNGAGCIGQYADCTFRSSGVGTFRGNEKTNPFLGKANELEFANEDRLETVLHPKEKSRVIKALLQAHPYEEVAYDLFELKNQIPGLGRIGYLPKPLSPKQLALSIKKKFQIDDIRFLSQSKKIKKIAIITGGAGSLYAEAIKQNCDAYISGDIKHNEWLEAEENGLTLIDAGHYGTEKIFGKCLKLLFSNRKLPINTILSSTQKIPFQRI